MLEWFLVCTSWFWLADARMVLYIGREATWPLVVMCTSFLCLKTLTKPGLELPAAAQSWEPSHCSRWSSPPLLQSREPLPLLTAECCRCCCSLGFPLLTVELTANSYSLCCSRRESLDRASTARAKPGAYNLLRGEPWGHKAQGSLPC